LDISIKHSNFNESTLIWAIICSILLHILLFVVIPNFKFDAIKEIPDQLTVEILQPKPPEPAPEPEPEPPKPEPIKEVVKPKIIPKPISKPIEKPSPVEQEAPPPPVVDKVVAVEPKPDSKPAEFIAPEPVEKPIEPLPVNLDDALGEYAGTLGRAIAKHKQYPKIAQMRGWEGEVMLDLKLDGDGNVISANVRNGSGYEALDKQALEMVKKASPFPRPPEALRGRSFNITVPVSFKLENS